MRFVVIRAAQTYCDSVRAIPATMPGMSFPLSAQRIAAYLTQDRASPGASIAIEVVAETGSTNADLMARLPHLPGPVLRAAENQTAGRGRAGRSWFAEPGATLTFSLAWHFPHPIQRLIGLPLAAGVALAETLAEVGVPVSLKWPNDVLKEGRKLGGILIESAKASAADGSWAVIGIGLNLMQPRHAEEIGQPVASMDLADLDTNELLAKIIARLGSAMKEFEQQGLSAFVERWNAMHAHAGQAVRILEGEQIKHEGRVLGIDEHGALRLQTAGGIISVMSGDISLRPVVGRKEGKHAVTG